MKHFALCLLLACCGQEPPLPLPPPPPPPPRAVPLAHPRPKVTPPLKASIKVFRRSEKAVLDAVTNPNASPDEIRDVFEKQKRAHERLQDELDQGRNATSETKKAAREAVEDFSTAVRPKPGPSRRKAAVPSPPPRPPPPPSPPPAPPPLPRPPTGGIVDGDGH